MLKDELRQELCFQINIILAKRLFRVMFVLTGTARRSKRPHCFLCKDVDSASLTVLHTFPQGEVTRKQHIPVLSYRSLVLQAHHECAHISCWLVVDDDHGFFLGDRPHIITPFCYCETKQKDACTLMKNTLCKYYSSNLWSFNGNKVCIYISFH